MRFWKNHFRRKYTEKIKRNKPPVIKGFFYGFISRLMVLIVIRIYFKRQTSLKMTRFSCCTRFFLRQRERDCTSNRYFKSLVFLSSYSIRILMSHSLTHSLTQSLTQSLTHSLSHSLSHSLTQSLTQSLSKKCLQIDSYFQNLSRLSSLLLF